MLHWTLHSHTHLDSLCILTTSSHVLCIVWNIPCALELLKCWFVVFCVHSLVIGFTDLSSSEHSCYYTSTYWKLQISMIRMLLCSAGFKRHNMTSSLLMRYSEDSWLFLQFYMKHHRATYTVELLNTVEALMMRSTCHPTPPSCNQYVQHVTQ